MSLILAVTFLALALILFRLLFRAARSANSPRWLQYWLAGDMLVCVVSALFAFSGLYLVKMVADFDTAPVGIGHGAAAAGIGALAWLAMDRLSERRRTRRAAAAPLAGGRAPAA